jgi:hypothetical protein
VNKATTTTALTSSPNPSTGGQTVTFTATVTPSGGPAPTGTVTFKSNGTSIGSANLSSGVGTLKYAGLPAGTLSITATYNGSTDDAGSTSSPLSQVVNLEPTTSTLTTSPNPSTSGETVTETCTVTTGNGSTPVGTAAFYSGSTLLGNVNLNSSAVATFSHAFTTGTYSLTCKYGATTRWGASTSNTVTQTVN